MIYRYKRPGLTPQQQNEIINAVYEYEEEIENQRKRAKFQSQFRQWANMLQAWFFNRKFSLPESWFNKLVEIQSNYNEELIDCQAGKIARSEAVLDFWDLVLEHKDFVKDIQTSILGVTPIRFRHVRLIKRYLLPTNTTYGQLNQKEVLNLLDGLEWHATSDLFFLERTSEWLVELCDALTHCLMRCFYIATHCTDLKTLNAERYRTEVKRIEYGGIKVRAGLLNYEFEFLVETVCRNIWLHVLEVTETHDPILYQETTSLTESEQSAFDSILGRCMRRAEQLNSVDVTDNRRRYVDDLQISWGDRRWAKLFSSDLNHTSAAREFIVKRDRGRKYRNHCEDKNQILFGKNLLKKTVESLEDSECFEKHEILSEDSLLYLYSRALLRGGNIICDLIKEEVFQFVRILQRWVFNPKDGDPIISSESLTKLFVLVRIRALDRLKKVFTKYSPKLLDDELGLIDLGSSSISSTSSSKEKQQQHKIQRNV